MAKITLQPIERDDLDILQGWRNSESILPYCRQHKPLSEDDMLIWYDTGDRDELFVIEYNAKQIGVGGLVRIDWRNRKGEVSFYVAEKVGNQVITEALVAVIQYGLATLGLWKVYFPVYSFNPKLPLYEKVMKREYIALKEYYWNGKHHDRIILTRFQNEHLQSQYKI